MKCEPWELKQHINSTIAIRCKYCNGKGIFGHGPDYRQSAFACVSCGGDGYYLKCFKLKPGDVFNFHDIVAEYDYNNIHLKTLSNIGHWQDVKKRSHKFNIMCTNKSYVVKKAYFDRVFPFVDGCWRVIAQELDYNCGEFILTDSTIGLFQCADHRLEECVALGGIKYVTWLRNFVPKVASTKKKKKKHKKKLKQAIKINNTPSIKPETELLPTQDESQFFDTSQGSLVISAFILTLGAISRLLLLK